MPAGSPLTACGDRLQRASSGFWIPRSSRGMTVNINEYCSYYYETVNSNFAKDNKGKD